MRYVRILIHKFVDTLSTFLLCSEARTFFFFMQFGTCETHCSHSVLSIQVSTHETALSSCVFLTYFDMCEIIHTCVVFMMQSGTYKITRVFVFLAQVGTRETTLSNFAEERRSNGSGPSSGDHTQAASDALISSDTSPGVTVSGQSSSSGKAQQRAVKPKLDTSTENGAQPGPSRQREHVGSTSGAGIGKDRPSASDGTADSDTRRTESDGLQETQGQPTVYGVLLHALCMIK
jgi:hypothetical protein